MGLFKSRSSVEDILEERGFGFDFSSLIDKMKSEDVWKKGELNSKILLISPGKRIILVAFHPGTEVKSYQGDNAVSLEILQGKLKFKARKVFITLIKGQSLTLYEKTKYSITALEETIFTMTIENDTIASSVN